ncbi:hypothetical protein GCM10023321_15090 [Pseudonocardia eucalypti]|uniref:Tail specific protease domain-containing protein n=1 Tax=Pseudonocardia eucalypti TaxID=648755 RepID=A0ABP9PQ08_9PSEU|nr:hypothetical protein [Pseudonocardia eucalypti]
MNHSRKTICRAWIAAFAALLPISGCSSSPPGGGGAAAGSLDGVWRSDGYGLVFDIGAGRMKISQVTKISCAVVTEANQSAATSDGAGTTFLVDKKKRSQPVLDVDSGLLTVSAGQTPDTRRLRVDGAISDIVLQRVDRMPEVCSAPPANTPVHNFDIFWQAFHENYPFFALHNVNWDEQRARFRPRVNDATTPAQLHALFVEMIKPLEDAHTSVALDGEDDDLEFDGNRPDPQPLSDDDLDLVNETVNQKLVDKRQRFAEKKISLGHLPNNVGYLRVSSFEGYADTGRFEDEVAELGRALDAAFASPMSGLVIDVRMNDGGSDVLATMIASRLTTKPYVAYAKTARNDPDDAGRFTEPQTITVQPGPGKAFTGQVALLISRYSVSAAETFAQSLIGRPGVTRIGESTQGVFSDVLNWKLPNGITFGLPNEVYTTDGKAYDKVGVPADINTGLVFQRANLQAHRDPELEAALTTLSNHR